MENKTTQPKAIVFNPQRDTSKATKAAKQLMDIVKQNGWAIKLGGQKAHIVYEGWQTVGKYYNSTVATGEAEPVEIGGVTGFRAKAWVIDNRSGLKVGEAEAYCMKDEPNWKNKPLFQLASMAQTRAGAKSLRQIFGFVVALAGYNPTPAEEMIAERTAEQQQLGETDSGVPTGASFTTPHDKGSIDKLNKCPECRATGKFHAPHCKYYGK